VLTSYFLFSYMIFDDYNIISYSLIYVIAQFLMLTILHIGKCNKKCMHKNYLTKKHVKFKFPSIWNIHIYLKRLENAACFKKSFTTFKVYINLNRGHTTFRIVIMYQTHRVLPRIVMVRCDFLWHCGRHPTCSQSLATCYVASLASLLQLR
jgi:5-bromo-4-chloroindolyl phosphate hydrolysis protein